MPITPSLRHCSNKYKLAREGEKGEEKDEVNGKSSSVERDEFFRCCLKIDGDPAARMRVERSFHQPGTVNENVLESDFEPLCDGTTRLRSLADLRLLEGM